jgi:hypothetical protein
MKGIYQFNLLLLLTISVLTSCNQKKDGSQMENLNKHSDSLSVDETAYGDVKMRQKQDTIRNYWQLTYDTIASRTDLKILDENYILELKTFSLNDSAIVRKLDDKYIDYSHTIVTDIQVINNSNIVQKRIDKTIFKEHLIPEFYDECNLLYTEYESVLNNQIHLTSILSIPDTDNQWQVKYSLSLSEDIDRLMVKDVSYVGN